MIKIDVNDDDDFEPIFYVRYIDKDDYWEKYNRMKKSWFRLCDQCSRKICKSSNSLCTLHLNQSKKNKTKITKTKSKRLNANTRIKKKKKSNNNERKHSIESNIEDKIEQIETNEINESLGMIISISSSLNKKQLSQVKEFITKFHSNIQPIQFTCEFQPEYIDDTTTHVITNDCGSFSTNITKQIIQACVRHIFIASINWIISSLQQSYILDHFPYEILRDNKSLTNTRGIKQCRFDHLPVFPSSCIIAVECHNGIKQMQITRDELIEIIELSGASLYHDYLDYQTLIILCNTKREMIESKRKYFDYQEKELLFCKPNFLFNSIVKHDVQLIEKYLW